LASANNISLVPIIGETTDVDCLMIAGEWFTMSAGLNIDDID